MPEIEVEPAGSIITLADDVDDYLQDGPPMYDPPGLPFLG